jgi:hypothetical protein
VREPREISADEMFGCVVAALAYAGISTDYYTLQSQTVHVMVQRGLLDIDIPIGGQVRMPEKHVLRFRDTLWECFRQGLIAPGQRDGDWTYARFSRTEQGDRIVAATGVTVYDPGSYLHALNTAHPLDEVEQRFVTQGMAAFRQQLFDAAVVMVGCAAEHLLVALGDALIVKSPASEQKVQNALRKQVSDQIKYFEGALAGQDLPPELERTRADRFRFLASIIREVRNEGGHPIAQPVDRETCEVAFSLYRHYRQWAYSVVAALTQ